LQYIVLILALVIQINLINAVVIEPYTSFNNTITGTNITCLNTYYAYSITVHNNVTGFTFNQFNRDNSLTNYITFTINENNKNYLCSDLPYISGPSYFYSQTVDTATYTIPSGLIDSFASTISFNHADCFTQVGNTLKLNGNIVNYTCLNGNITLTSNLINGNNLIVISYNKQPQAGGGGGGGFIPTINVTNRLCELTYKYADNKTYTMINDIIEIYKVETSKTESYTTVKDIIDNWQSLCSDKINKTQFEPYVCDKLYFFVLDGELDMGSLNDLRNNLKSKVTLSLDLIYYYLKDYDELCYKTGYSGKLSSEQLKLPGLIISPGIKNCSLEFGSDIFNFYIPIGSWNLGVFDDCNKLTNWRYILAFDSADDSYYIIGIRLYLIVLILLIIMVVALFKISSKNTIRL